MYQNLYSCLASDVYYKSTRSEWDYDEDEPALSWPLAGVRGQWYLKPSCKSKIAITSSWCQTLPNATLMCVRDRLTHMNLPYAPGINMYHMISYHMTSGDDMIVSLALQHPCLNDGCKMIISICLLPCSCNDLSWLQYQLTPT